MINTKIKKPAKQKDKKKPQSLCQWMTNYGKMGKISLRGGAVVGTPRQKKHHGDSNGGGNTEAEKKIRRKSVVAPKKKRV